MPSICFAIANRPDSFAFMSWIMPGMASGPDGDGRCECRREHEEPREQGDHQDRGSRAVRDTEPIEICRRSVQHQSEDHAGQDGSVIVLVTQRTPMTAMVASVTTA